MSKLTDINLRNLFIYQVYVRNHTHEGTFKALEADLDRIKALGVDVVYLLPIHEIGEEKRKGKLGSPYAIKDYYSINHELGTLEDFKDLIQAVHDKGMKIMMDIVFNHTSPDSLLINKHPEYFYRNEKGEFANRVGDWWDIKDFDYSKDKGLETYLIENLIYWTKLGVDGFRFDVPSLLPLEFLANAHEAVLEVNPHSIWLSESVHGHFLKHIRDLGFDALSESEVYQVFDMSYDYDTHPFFEAYLKGEGTLKAYTDAILAQEWNYPKNYIKMRNLENHDFGRVAGMVKEDPLKLENWHAFSFFAKGSTMVFTGGEFSNPHHPDLFNKDTISREGRDLSELILTLSTLVKAPAFSQGVFELEAKNDQILGSYQLDGKKVYGIFNVSQTTDPIEIDLPDGAYVNRIYDEELKVINGKIQSLKPIIIFE